MGEKSSAAGSKSGLTVALDENVAQAVLEIAGPSW